VEHQLDYVAVEGPIGVGKTTLARRLAKSLGSRLVLENAEQNPFLEDFYRAPARNALSTQLHFLMSRRRSLATMLELGSNPGWVSDFLFYKDRLFAELTLDPVSLSLYNDIEQGLNINLPVPDLVVYLQAPLDVLYERIEKRGIKAEQSIASSYLSRMQQAYTEFFHSYDQTPVLIVNAEEIDFVDNEHDYRGLLEQVLTVRAGRHYFNPGTVVTS